MLKPGYYPQPPRRPDGLDRLDSVSGKEWWGWYTPRFIPVGWESGDYLYIRAENQEEAIRRFQRMFPGADGGNGCRCQSPMRQNLAERKACVVAWEDGRWARYDFGVRSTTSYGKL